MHIHMNNLMLAIIKTFIMWLTSSFSVIVPLQCFAANMYATLLNCRNKIINAITCTVSIATVAWCCSDLEGYFHCMFL